MSDDQALKRLEAFLGTWSLSADFPNMAEPVPDVEGRAKFEWLLDGKFIVERSEVDHPDAPNGFVIIAPDGKGEDSYTEHYFDTRGVIRTYAMTFDGRTISGKWEICHDGENWEHDFDLNYTKID